MKRYGVIDFKHKREIVLLQGRGCAYKGCRFCDYYLDVSQEATSINMQVLNQVEGKYGVLEVINSGSFNELDQETLEHIRVVAKRVGIHTLIFECHYLYRKEIARLKEFFGESQVRIKIGIESFDVDLRERVLNKGIKESEPSVIAQDFDEANLLIGVEGQSLAMIAQDIELGLRYFDRICLNVMCDNSKMRANQAVIAEFKAEILPMYWDNPRIDILLENTDFGVG
ncbi:radical SAM protein [Helicobacter enhydrae]|uniref:Radical SAM protein n=1 Tax=Helicobacter enhydrae TaxID=222136 RepID=A0A1B1U512_9HELI|nr:radical SAM protein [Helicobacter enhydrae]ANV97838.1 radical SAM protein [Helicobacter enhydrae]